MMSPIALYLTEFRPGGVPTPTSPPAADEQPAFGLSMSFETDEAFASSTDGEMPADLSFEAAPDLLDMPAAADVPESDLSAVVAALQSDHAAALAEARQQWATDEGAVLAALIGTKLSELETRLGDALAPLLEPFLVKAAQIKVLDQMRDTLGTLLAGGDQRAITITGPADLVDAIRQSYPGRPALAFATADAPDVTIAVGDTRIRSQLRAWARKLDSALEGSRA